MTELALADGFLFEDLYCRDGLLRLDALFLESLDGSLRADLEAARMSPDALEPKAESELVLALAPGLEGFLARLFGIEAEAAALSGRHTALAPVYRCKRLFVQRRAARAVKPAEAADLDGGAVEAALAAHMPVPVEEEAFSAAVLGWLADEANSGEALEAAARYAAWALHHPEGRARHAGGVLFKQPARVDPLRLIYTEVRTENGADGLELPRTRLRRREGFALTDDGMDLKAALDQAHYCIFCHNQGKDSCARGLRDRRTGAFGKTMFGVELAGCPLEEKVSEMQLLKTEGWALGALATVCIDNPLCAATGHRICNDCMKSCIYQKQEPVDIPQVETRVLKDVLDLPWGFEIYSLLTRWNPLNFARPLPLPETGRQVLVVGLGPAGFSLAHHLMNDGHRVVAVDGLKIEPVPAAQSGVDETGGRQDFRPVRDMAEIREDLSERVMAGFGGVAEYGITVRWDKNFLKLVRLLLERRSAFTMVGGVRFGGTLGLDEAFEWGFDHVAMAAGAGRPTHVPMPNALAPGVRMASDFLMALQLTGAARTDSIANLQIRLPAVVVGGGLTAIDTATESLAYYPVQVEKFLARYEALGGRVAWTEDEADVAEEFLAHARAIRAERARAAAAGEAPRILELLRSWGGVTIAYRRRLIDAPCYTLNHEEVAKALEEGIRFAECLSPLAVEVDDRGRAAALRLERVEIDDRGRRRALGDGETVSLPARTVLVAAGTQPNTVLGRESAGITLDGRYFQAVDGEGKPVVPEPTAKPEAPAVLMQRREDGRAVSFFGDLHPSFAGNVVKAMGGVKQAYPLVSLLLAESPPATEDDLADRANRELRARVHEVVRLTPKIVEVVVEAPAAARAFRPGQFYRLQNFESRSLRRYGTVLAMEGLAMTGAWVDRKRGLLSTIILEMGGSSDLAAALQPGEPVVLMGPTGSPTEIPKGETVLLAGGGLGNAVLFSIGRALREAGNRVLYFAGYKEVADRYKTAEIEAAADVVVWCCDEAPGFVPARPQDFAWTGNIVEAMATYGEGRMGAPPIPLGEVDRILAIGSDGMMAAVDAARRGVLGTLLKPGHRAIGSINSPMQCMMKEICAQCLQLHRDPETGEERVVYSCFNQDQPLDLVDFPTLRGRLSQNGAQEKLTAAWIAHCLQA